MNFLCTLNLSPGTSYNVNTIATVILGLSLSFWDYPYISLHLKMLFVMVMALKDLTSLVSHHFNP